MAGSGKILGEVLRSYIHPEMADFPACPLRDNPRHASVPLNYLPPNTPFPLRKHPNWGGRGPGNGTIHPRHSRAILLGLARSERFFRTISSTLRSRQLVVWLLTLLTQH
jgi:hypothetical protein